MKKIINSLRFIKIKKIIIPCFVIYFFDYSRRSIKRFHSKRYEKKYNKAFKRIQPELVRLLDWEYCERLSYYLRGKKDGEIIEELIKPILQGNQLALRTLEGFIQEYLFIYQKNLKGLVDNKTFERIHKSTLQWQQALLSLRAIMDIKKMKLPLSPEFDQIQG